MIRVAIFMFISLLITHKAQAEELNLDKATDKSTLEKIRSCITFDECRFLSDKDRRKYASWAREQIRDAGDDLRYACTQAQIDAVLSYVKKKEIEREAQESRQAIMSFMLLGVAGIYGEGIAIGIKSMRANTIPKLLIQYAYKQSKDSKTVERLIVRSVEHLATELAGTAGTEQDSDGSELERVSGICSAMIDIYKRNKLKIISSLEGDGSDYTKSDLVLLSIVASTQTTSHDFGEKIAQLKEIFEEISKFSRKKVEAVCDYTDGPARCGGTVTDQTIPLIRNDGKLVIALKRERTLGFSKRLSYGFVKQIPDDARHLVELASRKLNIAILHISREIAEENKKNNRGPIDFDSSLQ